MYPMSNGASFGPFFTVASNLYISDTFGPSWELRNCFPLSIHCICFSLGGGNSAARAGTFATGAAAAGAGDGLSFGCLSAGRERLL